MRPIKTLVCLSFVAVLAAGAAADEVRLVNGNVVEGRAKRVGDTVVVVTTAGEVKLPAKDVASIVPGRSLVDDYDDRVAALATGGKNDGAADHLALAAWCRQNKLKSKSRQHLKKVLAFDPDHAEARKLLGYIRYDEQWMTEVEYYEARGFVLEKGKWVNRETVRRVKYEKDAKAAQKAHLAKINDCVKRMGSPLRKPRLLAKLELQEYAEGRSDLRLAAFASKVADHYNGQWREVRRILSRGTALTEVRATMTKLKRPIPVIQTSLGAGSTPVRIQTPELAIVSVKTTALIPLNIELDEDP